MKSLDVHDPLAWPPGSMMLYNNTPFSIVEPPTRHSGVGLVVSNEGGFIKVLWDADCADRFCTYLIEDLNREVVSRVP